MDAEYLKNLKRLNERAGDWYTVAENGTVDICTRKPRRPAVIALMVSPEDAECIIAEHEAVPRLVDEVGRLRLRCDYLERRLGVEAGPRVGVMDVDRDPRRFNS